LATTEITKETENIDVWILAIGNSAADEDDESYLRREMCIFCHPLKPELDTP
jgi:hypothetical protein